MDTNSPKFWLACVAGILFLISYFGLPTVGVAGIVLSIAVALPR